MPDRRSFLGLASVGLLVACHGAKSPEQREEDEDVGAVEDLMREHGVIRRILGVYRACVMRLRQSPASVTSEPLQRAAKLMRTFGEDYHEHQLEEAHIFPAIKRANPSLAPRIDALLAQHQRGREITDYIASVAAKTIDDPETLARTFDDFTRMYEEHAAFEDTIIFPAWKKTMSPHQLEEMGDAFEDIERKTFGKDGFDDAVVKISQIERDLAIDPLGLLPEVPKPR
jgi:hemerythrin-like domain-containing protein